MTDLDKALNCLDELDPRMASYESWLHAGIILKSVGASVEDWEHWSKKDSERYNPGECKQLWDKFSSNRKNPLTIATLILYTRNPNLFEKNKEK
jgi:hypothetical protein